MVKPSNPSRLQKLLQHPAFQAFSGLAALGLAYVFASSAIDSGSLLDYAITLLLIFVGLRELAVAISASLRK